jgi:hypothetical protein
MHFFKKIILQTSPENNSCPRAIQLLKNYPNIDRPAKEALDLIKPYLLDVRDKPLRILLENNSFKTNYDNEELAARFHETKAILVSLFKNLKEGKKITSLTQLKTFLEEPVYDLAMYEETHPEQFETQYWRKYADAYAHIFIASINLLFSLIIKHGHDNDPAAIDLFKRALEKYVCETPSNAFCVNDNQTHLLAILFTVRPGIAKKMINKRLSGINNFPDSAGLAEVRFIIFLLRNSHPLQHLLNKENIAQDFLPKWKKITEEEPQGLYVSPPPYLISNFKYYLETCIQLFS